MLVHRLNGRGSVACFGTMNRRAYELADGVEVKSRLVKPTRK
jgi:hypothetical protein